MEKNTRPVRGWESEQVYPLKHLTAHFRLFRIALGCKSACKNLNQDDHPACSHSGPELQAVPA
jgi:hypothetical protein